VLDEGVLEAGTYSVLIEPVWNESADTNSDYRKIIVDLYCRQ